MSKKLEQELAELRRRVEELERRPVYYPAPVWVQPVYPTPSVPPWPPWQVPIVTCDTVTYSVSATALDS